MSVPATSSIATQVHYRNVLDRAGVPKATVIVSEGDAASNFYFNGKSFLGRLKDIFVLDVGGMTLDGAAARTYSEDGKAKVVQTIPPMGDYNGALKMRDISVKVLKEKAGLSLDVLSKSLKLEPKRSRKVETSALEQFFQKVGESFEMAGREYRGTRGPGRRSVAKFQNHSEFAMHELEIPKELSQHIKFRLISKKPVSWNVTFSNALVKEVFNKWLESVVDMLLRMIMKHQESFPKSIPHVVLCGRGALPPYVLQRCRFRLSQEMPGTTIEYIESLRTPVVAHGNFIMAVRGDLLASEAQTSYGLLDDIRLADIPSNERNYRDMGRNRSANAEFLNDRIRWFVEKGKDLRNLNAPLINESKRVFFIKTKQDVSPFPINCSLRLFVSGHPVVVGADKYRPAKDALADGHIFKVVTIMVEIFEGDLEVIKQDVGTSRDQGGNKIDTTRIQIRFRTKVCFDSVQPHLVISVPCKMRDTADNNKGPQQWLVVAELPLEHLCTLATDQGLEAAQKAAGWPAESTDDVLARNFSKLRLETLKTWEALQKSKKEYQHRI